jgi:hypothetical protein
MGINQVLSAPRSALAACLSRTGDRLDSQRMSRPYGCVNESSLRRILSSYCGYYHYWGTHLSLHKSAPETRTVQPQT